MNILIIIGRLLTLLIITNILFACTISEPKPDTRYYILDAKPLQATLPKSSDEQVQVSSIRVPDYLNQANLVIKLSDHRLQFTNYHFWADDLRTSIQGIVINELNSLNEKYTFSQGCKACPHVSISIDHFYPTESGKVILSGSVRLEHKEQLYHQQNFYFEEQLSEGGFDESVSKMRYLLSLLAKQIEQSF